MSVSRGAKTLVIASGRTVTVSSSAKLTVAKGAALTVEGGGKLVNEGSIVNDGLVRLPAGSSKGDLKNITGSGVIEIDGKAVPKESTQKEKGAAKKIIDKINRASIASSSLRAADGDPMEAELKDGDILFDAEGIDIEGSLCTMSINVEAKPNG